MSIPKKEGIMDNEGFKKILSEVGMTKKDFAEKVGLAYQTVAGWTNQGYPVWMDSYVDMMLELNECIKSANAREEIKPINEEGMSKYLALLEARLDERMDSVSAEVRKLKKIIPLNDSDKH